MSRRRRRAMTAAPLSVPGILLVSGWVRLGEPMHQAGLGTVLGLGLVAAVLMPGAIVSAEALPMLLVPSRARIWWRRGQDHRPAIPAYLRRAVYAADRHRCCWCGSGEQLQVDHIKPWSRGGLSTLWNLATLCGPCNMTKSNYWVTRSGYVFYTPFPGAVADQRVAAQVLAYEKQLRWNPLRWLRAGWSIAS